MESLPLANVGQTARLLYDRLTFLNTHQISPTDQLAILEALRPAVDLVLESLGRHYLHQDLPLAGRPALVAKLARELLVMMVGGYQLALQQLSGGSSLTRVIRNGRRGEALHRRLHYLGQILLHDYQLYRKHPKGLWREVHSTYLAALQSALHERPFASEDARAPGRSTISDLYKQILLLGLAGPYRMLQGEVQRVYRALHRWAPLSRLEPLEPSRTYSASYLVDPGADLPPTYRDNLAAGNIRAWVLDTSRLSDALSRELEAFASASAGAPARPDDPAAPVGAELLGRLALAWGLGGTRAAARESADGELGLVYGIDAIIRSLGREDLIRGSANPVNAGAGLSAEEDAMPSFGSSLWPPDAMAVGEDIAIRAGKESPPPWSKTQQDAMAHLDHARIVDRSPRGFHVRLNGRGKRPRRVGDLVGVVEPGALSEPGAWRVGVVRWMRADAPDDVRLGVEILSDRPEPVALCWQARERGEEVSVPSLLVGDADADDGVFALLTPTFYPASDDRLKLSHGGRVQAIRVLQAIERTRSFAHCRYLPTGAGPAPAPPRETRATPVAEPVAPEDEFDTLWRNL